MYVLFYPVIFASVNWIFILKLCFIIAGSANWLILVQNDGEKSLKAKIVLPVNSLQELTLPKHQSQRVRLSISFRVDSIDKKRYL